MRVSIGICTFRRAHVADTLRAALAQAGTAQVQAIEVLIADNDDTPSAERLVAETAAHAPAGAPPVRYLHAPARNISAARNAILESAAGDWIAFLDDDETVAPDWLARLAAAAAGADVVFGPVLARYPDDAPAWIRAGDFHSTRLDGDPQRRGQGHSGAALMRWRGAPWADVRFDLALGRSGGEDTAFFDALRARGARMAYAPDAEALEDAPPERLTFAWLWRRRFRYGQTHAVLLTRARAVAPAEAVKASAKAAACFAMAGVSVLDGVERRRWLLRAALHCGVVARLAGRRDLELY